jgi:hypothetical protein
MAESALRQIATQSAEPYVRSYNPLNPKFRESVRSALNDLVGGSNIASNQGYGRGRMVDMLTGTVDFAPVLGDAVGIGETRQALNEGDYLSAGIIGTATALGMVPIVGDVAGKALRRAGTLDMSSGALKNAPEGAPSPLEGTLDMSTEARMQKAAEGGYLPETYYHATSSDFEEFVPKYADQLTFITPNVNFANNWLGKGGSRSKLGSARYDDPLNLEYKAESKKIWDKYSSEYGVDINSWPEIEQQNYRAERNKVMNLFDSVDQSIYPLRTNVQNTFDPRQHEDVIVEYLQSQGRDPLATTIQGGITDLDYYKMGNYLLYENPEMVQLLKNKGFDSMRLAESTYDRSVAPVFDTLAVFNPSNIRSVNAAFDPAKRGSANLMAGAAGATIGLSALRNIQRDEEPQPD